MDSLLVDIIPFGAVARSRWIVFHGLPNQEVSNEHAWISEDAYHDSLTVILRKDPV